MVASGNRVPYTLEQVIKKKKKAGENEGTPSQESQVRREHMPLCSWVREAVPWRGRAVAAGQA